MTSSRVVWGDDGTAGNPTVADLLASSWSVAGVPLVDLADVDETEPTCFSVDPLTGSERYVYPVPGGEVAFMRHDPTGTPSVTIAVLRAAPATVSVDDEVIRE